MVNNPRIIPIDKKLVVYLLIAGMLPFFYFFFEELILGDKLGHSMSTIEMLKHAALNLIISCSITVCISIIVISEFNWLERKYPWSDFAVKRLVIEFFMSSMTAGTLMFLFAFIMENVFGLHHCYTKREYYFSNIATGIIMNIFVATFFECYSLFARWKESLVQNERLAKESLQAHYQALKTQINPHFLFNSLNVLSGLVHTDPDKAEEFIDEFARVYRYILEVHENDLVTLEDELTMVKSYIYLQKIRFGEGIDFSFDVPAHALDRKLPSLSLQLLAENAIKHNITSRQQVLRVHISSDGHSLRVENNLQKRSGTIASTGIGQKNLLQRYLHYSSEAPVFMEQNGNYICVLPLI